MLRHYHSAFEVDFKDKHKSDPVTEADREVEAYITKAVAERFPDHVVLGEEGQEPREGAEFVWIVDPVDGTLNFVNRLPCFAVSIGVLYKHRPVVGALSFPITGEILHARLGGGAYRGDERIHVRQAERLRPDILGLLAPGFRSGFRASPALLRRLGDSRTFGSIVYELGLVAGGSAGYALFGSPKIWDVAGGIVLVREAGGEALEYTEGRWRPLTKFEPRPARKPDKPPSLRYWGRPVLCGSPRLVNTMARFIAPRHAPRLLRKVLSRYRR